ncbi:hypothetical protein ANANG_G00067290 [Anguilla anguilla]|uniref:Uncharacterized protein n=1 Tax=Anguilla anguilla TaxID=7936 RepID=A0A9D3MQ02_ANGAN|nr:hypothetical protein ANANG_G00067290 [Anguilla anguilla]
MSPWMCLCISFAGWTLHKVSSQKDFIKHVLCLLQHSLENAMTYEVLTIFNPCIAIQCSNSECYRRPGIIIIIIIILCLMLFFSKYHASLTNGIITPMYETLPSGGETTETSDPRPYRYTVPIQ